MAQPTTIPATPGPALRGAWDAALTLWTETQAAAVAAEWGDKEAEAHHAAWRDLMGTPAPDCAALHWKLSHMFGEPGRDGFCVTWANDLLASVLADSSRLAMEGR